MSHQESLIAGAVGAGAAIVLGIVLVPLREVTPASNLAFAFLILIIAVAEYGGRTASLATAIVSALSLNFFLTRPYLGLTIHDRNDVIAFLGLAACGLAAAAFGSRRGASLAMLRRERAQGRIIRALARDLAQGAPVEPAIASTLREIAESFPVSAAAVRNARGRIVAASPKARDLAPPGKEARIDAFAVAEGPSSIPETGIVLVLEAGPSLVGSLELWGDGGRLTLDGRSGIADVARLLALLLWRNP